MQHEQLLEQLYNGQILNKAESAVILMLLCKENSITNKLQLC